MDDRHHDELKSLIAPYVLGAAPPEDLPRIRSHILSCEECMAEADSYSEVTDSLALMVEPVPVPAGLGERVMEIALGPRTEAEPTARPSAGRRWRLVQVFSYAALIVGVAVLAGGLIDTRNDLQTNRRVMTSLLHSNGMELAGQAGAVARIVPTSDGATFVATGMGGAPEAHTYQLWLMRDQEPVSAGVFDGSTDVVVLELAQSLDGYDAAAVTIEPEGGSEQPTGEPIIASDPALLG